LTAAERAAALADPAFDPVLRDEVASLLGHELDAATDFLNRAAVPWVVPATAPKDRTGQRLGPWRIVRRIGTGGMGDVFEAHRADGRFQGLAAIKLLKRGMDSQAVLARFAQEQQALALLSHPHIARLLDAGISDDGLPYFVMERVQGQPIDQACEGLPLAQRLMLFLQLCEAVAHAHRNLLVHRDLKPSNVMVDDDGRVKLLDFGIAKARQRLAETTTTGMKGKYAYMSPEQCRGDPVDHRSDIFASGVVLWECLTRRRLFKHSNKLMVLKMILEGHVAPPSRVNPAVPPVLDEICLRALAKSPDERYSWAEEMSSDLDRALATGSDHVSSAQLTDYLQQVFAEDQRRRSEWANSASLADVSVRQETAEHWLDFLPSATN
jgi:serine/threonine protein kinase